MPRLIPVVVVIGLLAVAAVLLYSPSDSGDNIAPDSPLASDYDYTISNMQLDSFAPDGVLRYHLTSERLTHYPDPDHSVLDNPSLRWHEPGQPDWVLTSRSGDLRSDEVDGSSRLLLQQNVLASRSSGSGATLDIRSESLLVLPDAGELSTNDAIELHNGPTQLSSAGMQAWLRENRIKLSKGSGKHE